MRTDVLNENAAHATGSGKAKALALWGLQLLLAANFLLMVGAVMAEQLILSGNPIMPLVLLILLSVVAYTRRPRATGPAAGPGDPHTR